MRPSRRIKQLTVGIFTGLLLPMLSLYGCRQIATTESTKKSIGSSSFKSPYLYDSLLFEIAPITSCTPDKNALGYFRDKLEFYQICRQESVSFIIHAEEPLVRPQPMFLQHIYFYESIHRTYLDLDPNDRKGSVFVPYLSGPIVTPRRGLRVLGGIHYGETSFAIFKDGSQRREGSVLLHELGHMIGIRSDSLEPLSHCPNRNCIMWTTAISAYAEFCDDCREELAVIIREGK